MSGPLSASHFKSRRARWPCPTTPPRVEAARRGCGRNDHGGIFQTPIGRRVDRQIFHFTAHTRAGFWQEALANLQNTIDEKVEESGLPDNLAALRDRALNTVDAARVTCRREIEAFKREQEEHFSRLDAEAAAALRRTGQHLACFIARCAARDDRTQENDGWRDIDVEAAVALCTSERSGRVRGHGCRALWALLRRKAHRRAAADAGAAHLLLDCVRCPDVDDAVALAALALLARTEGRAILEAGGLERLADEAARAFARERTADAADMEKFVHIRSLAVAALYALVRGREVDESQLDALDERPMPIVALLAKDAASQATAGPGLALRAGSVYSVWRCATSRSASAPPSSGKRKRASWKRRSGPSS